MAKKEVAAQGQTAKAAKSSNDNRARDRKIVEEFVAGGDERQIARKYKIKANEVTNVVRGFADTVLKPIYGEVAIANPNMWVSSKLPAFNPSVLITRKGMAVFDLMMQDDQVKAAMMFKKLAAISSGWEIVSAENTDEQSDDIDFVKDQFNKIEGSFGQVLLDVMSALTFGFSVAEQIWNPIEAGQYAGMVGLKAIKAKKPHNISFKMDEYGNLMPNGIVQHSAQKGTQDLPTAKFVVFTHQKEFGNIYGKSDLEAAYSRWWIKENAYRWLAMLLERFGIPPIFAMYDPSSMNEEQVRKLRQVIERLQAATAGAIPRANKDALEMWSPELAGNTERVFIPALEMLNRDIARGLLMPGLLGLAPDTQTGSFARARVEFDVFILMIEHLRQIVSEVVNKQVVKPLVDFNFVVDAYPMFRFLPLVDDMRLDIHRLWQAFVAGRVVKPQREDEIHIRKAFGYPEIDGEHTDEDYGPPGAPAAPPPGTDPNAPPSDDEPEGEAPVEDEAPIDEEVAVGRKLPYAEGTKKSQLGRYLWVDDEIEVFGNDKEKEEEAEEGGPAKVATYKDQLRAPAGSPIGGQFIPGGGGPVSGEDFSDVARGSGGKEPKGFNKVLKSGKIDASGAEALKDYSFTALDMNGYMRTGELPKGSKLDAAKLDDFSEKMDAAFEKGVVQQDFVAYRGMVTNNFKGKKLEGSVIEDKVYLSTSLSKDAANWFASRPDQKGEKVLVKIGVPKGANALYIPRHVDSASRSEHEVLLPRGANLFVTSDKVVGGTRVIEAHYVKSLKNSEIGSQYQQHTYATAYEKKVDFKQITKDLDALEERARGLLIPPMLDVRDRFLDHVRRKFDYDPSYVRDLKELRGIPAVGNALTAFLNEAYDYGAGTIQKELPGKVKPHSLELLEAGAITDKQYAAEPNYRPKDAIKYLRAKTFYITGVIDGRIREKARGVLLNSITTGEPMDRTMAKLEDIFEPYVGKPGRIRGGEVITPNRLETIIRTNATDAFNMGRIVEARRAGPFLQAFQYSAIMDDATTKVCEFLDQKLFRPNDPALDQLSPPRAYNCRATVVPVGIDEEIDEDDFIDASEVAKGIELSHVDFGGESTRMYSKE